MHVTAYPGWALLTVLCFGTTAHAQEPAPGAAASQSSFPSRFSSEDTRLTTGIESSGASSSERSMHFLADFMLTAPLSGGGIKRDSKPRFGAWFNARLAGTPTQGVTGVKQFVGGFEQQLVAGSTSSLLNTVTVLAGGEIGSKGFTFGGDYQLEPLFIFGAGFTTTEPAGNQPPVFDITAQAKDKFGVPEKVGDTTIKYIGFVGPNRRQFYRQFVVGARFKTHHFENCKGRVNCDPDTRVNFPGLIDLTVGRNQAVTGGQWRGVVYRLDAFYPLPTDNVANAIYLFGTAELQSVKALKNDLEEDPVVLHGATANVVIPSPELWLHTVTPDERTRDEWKFGVGVDLVRLFTTAQGARDKDAAAAETGFSRMTLPPTDNADVGLVRVIVQKNEQGVLTASTDVLLPFGDGMLAEMSKDAIKRAVSLTADTPISAPVGPVKNTGSTELVGLLVRPKGTAKAKDLPSLAFDKKAFTAATEEAILPNERYTVSRVKCSAACALTATKIDRALVLIPIKADGLKAKAANKDEDVAARSPIVVERNTEVTFDFKPNGGSTLELLVIQIR